MNSEDNFPGWLEANYGKCPLSEAEVVLARQAWDAALIAAANQWQARMEAKEALRPADAISTISGQHSWRTAA